MTVLNGIKGVVLYLGELTPNGVDLRNAAILNDAIERDILVTFKPKPAHTHPVRVTKKDCR